MGFRFIHTADWQLGKPFGRFDDILSGRLSAQRQDVIGKIAQAAVENEAFHVLVAGDAWDNISPNNAILRQPLDIMAEWPKVTWWLLPGNHDIDGTSGLWDRVSDHAPDNVRVLRDESPVEMATGTWLLPAPWQRLHHGRDLTEWMDRGETPQGAIRIGIAHGSIKTFGTKHEGQDEGETQAIIPPDRAKRARLDYLALGDWHARTDINSRTFYSGTPEPDRFKSGARGQVLLVTIDGPGAEPTVEDIPTAGYDWPVIDVRLRVDNLDEVKQSINVKIGEGLPPRQTLAEIRVEGETTLQNWTDFEAFIDALTDRCAHVELRGASSVNILVVAEDIEALDAQGSVRQAAEALKQRRDDPSLSQSVRETAAEALRLLFGFAATESRAQDRGKL